MFSTRFTHSASEAGLVVPTYRIYRMKEAVRQQFRWAPHTIGVTVAKAKDYEQIDTVEAAGPYAVWIALKDTAGPLQIGDILESDNGELRIYKYVGFEEAHWFVPEVKPAPPETSAASV
jgi:hypothetical protein